MKWSTYNRLFTSKRHGWLIYNSAANAFAQIDEAVYPEILKIRENPGSYDFGKSPVLYLQLRENGILVEPRGDAIYRNILKMSRLSNNYDSGLLTLTIAPTRACNFDCVYCYEKEREPVFMSDETEEDVLLFIKRFRGATRLVLTWYGGEPLLCFNRIRSLTEKVKSLDLPFAAVLVTNGFLLDEEVISRLPDLKVEVIQVTVDGREPVHNRRRLLRGGGETFQRIMANVRTLAQRWEGSLLLRVNIDRTNRDEYHLIYRELRERFEKVSEKVRLSIYPGIVHDHNQHHPDVSCLIDRSEEAAFTIDEYYRHGINELRTFPERSYVGCIACRRNGFLIGPEGEIHKCWNDLGIKDRQVGSVRKGSTWNMTLMSDYMVGSSYLDDPECTQCFYLPVCDGGCSHQRLQNYLGHSKQDVCLKFKGRLEDLLEIYYEQKEKRSTEPEGGSSAKTP